jgi:hypothetical protein
MSSMNFEGEIEREFITLWNREHAADHSSFQVGLPITGIDRWGGAVPSPPGCTLDLLTTLALRFLVIAGTARRIASVRATSPQPQTSLRSALG